MSKAFTRTIEDFVCGHCGEQVKGNGYTNHCPKCLWSRHVDNNPGDRENPCQGMMKPVGVEMEHGEHILLHECQNCGIRKRNKVVPEDNFEELLKITKSQI